MGQVVTYRDNLASPGCPASAVWAGTLAFGRVTLG